MDQNNDAAQDELQQAINNITDSANASNGDSNEDVISQIEEQVAAAAPAVPAPEIPAPEAPVFDDKNTVSAAPAAPAVEMEPVRAVYGDPDLDKVKAGALSDIRPILEKIDITPEKKFMVYKDIIELWDDKGCIEPAYNAAKQVSDDKQRAEALLYIIETIDRLGIKMPENMR